MASSAIVFGGFSYARTQNLHRANQDALAGVLVGATFYGAIPYLAAALWRLSLLFSGGTVVTTVTTAAPATKVLYRAMSNAEFQQLMRTGQFHAGSNSLSGKWFAETLPSALRWGKALEGTGFRVVEIQVRTNAAQQFMRHERLDGIGPALYAELWQINHAIIKLTEVIPP
jgi:hypothetical protein